MGDLLLYKCRDCGYNRWLHVGVGMMFPRVCNAMRADIASGEYGTDLMRAYETCDHSGVAPEDTVFQCPACGHWDVDRDASVYEAADMEAVRERYRNIKSFEESGIVPWVTHRDIENGLFRLAAAYAPPCPKCGEGMLPMHTELKFPDDVPQLACPECGSSSAYIADRGYWD